MGLFATLSRKSAESTARRRELPPHIRSLVGRGFEAVAEAMYSGTDTLEACDVAGRRLAFDGAALEEVLDGLRETARIVLAADPAYDAIRAISVAWSEGTLAYLHQLSCEDPMTGLASMAHLRSRISELYRAAVRGGTGRDVTAAHALVVVELPHDRPGHGTADDTFSRTMRLARVGQSARTVFDGSETIARLGSNRVVVIVERDATVGRRVALLRTLLSSASFPTRVWIEGLPGSDAGAAQLLDELARS